MWWIDIFWMVEGYTDHCLLTRRGFRGVLRIHFFQINPDNIGAGIQKSSIINRQSLRGVSVWVVRFYLRLMIDYVALRTGGKDFV